MQACMSLMQSTSTKPIGCLARGCGDRAIGPFSGWPFQLICEEATQFGR